MDIINRIKCRMNGGHHYEEKSQRMINGGMGKMFIYSCKCGSEKVKFV